MIDEVLAQIETDIVDHQRGHNGQGVELCVHHGGQAADQRADDAADQDADDGMDASRQRKVYRGRRAGYTRQIKRALTAHVHLAAAEHQAHADAGKEQGDHFFHDIAHSGDGLQRTDQKEFQ